MSEHRARVIEALSSAGMTPTDADIDALVDAYPALLEMAKRLREVPDAKEESMEFTRDLAN